MINLQVIQKGEGNVRHVGIENCESWTSLPIDPYWQI